MMQRRKGDSASSQGAAETAHRAGARMPTSRRNRSGSSQTSLVAFLVAAVMVALLTFLFPSKVHEVEMSAYQVEQEMEKQVGEFWHHQKQHRPPVKKEQDGVKQEPVDATAASKMERHPSYWVDREKKLKEKLTPLFERQKKGLDLGVPILTRYVGEDIPAWVGGGVNEAEWKEKVEAKYKEDANEEKEWRERIKSNFPPQNAGKVAVQR